MNFPSAPKNKPAAAKQMTEEEEQAQKGGPRSVEHAHWALALWLGRNGR
jgi:hypothetical protein